MYPSIEEVFRSWRLPYTLAKEIEERYVKYGPKYMTEATHTDGRKINQCMKSNSAQDALEEVVDAVFNCLVLDLKGINASKMIRELCGIYEDLQDIRDMIEEERK